MTHRDNAHWPTTSQSDLMISVFCLKIEQFVVTLVECATAFWNFELQREKKQQTNTNKNRALGFFLFGWFFCYCLFLNGKEMRKMEKIAKFFKNNFKNLKIKKKNQNKNCHLFMFTVGRYMQLCKWKCIWFFLCHFDWSSFVLMIYQVLLLFSLLKSYRTIELQMKLLLRFLLSKRTKQSEWTEWNK